MENGPEFSYSGKKVPSTSIKTFQLCQKLSKLIQIHIKKMQLLELDG